MYSYDRSKIGAAPNRYEDDVLDAGYIANQVVMYGKSSGWAMPTETSQLHLAKHIEEGLRPFNIGFDPKTGTWGHKPGGSHVFK
jgi:hypothetical protein